MLLFSLLYEFNKSVYPFFSIWDALLPPIYFAIILIHTNIIKNKNIATNPLYKYYAAGLYLKLLGAIGVCMVYTQYYLDGDTTWYYHADVCI
jgi:hypothetical protein